MGKMAWDANQINRSMSVRLKGDYAELEVFRAAKQYLSHTKVIKSKKGDSFAIPASPVPELVAANLAAERHWCACFRDLVSDKTDRHVVHAMVGVARDFGIKTVAEGVEDQETLELLSAMGVDYAQGFWIGRPAPIEELWPTTKDSARRE